MSVGLRYKEKDHEWCFEISLSHPHPITTGYHDNRLPRNIVLRLEKVVESGLGRRKTDKKENFLVIFTLC